MSEPTAEGSDQEVPVPETFDILGALPFVEYAPPVSEDRVPPPPLKPWHRPRKQLVRKRQWLGALRELLDGAAADIPVSYVGLPGSDLIDLRLMREECQEHGLTFFYLGF